MCKNTTRGVYLKNITTIIRLKNKKYLPQGVCMYKNKKQ